MHPGPHVYWLLGPTPLPDIWVPYSHFGQCVVALTLQDLGWGNSGRFGLPLVSVGEQF